IAPEDDIVVAARGKAVAEPRGGVAAIGLGVAGRERPVRLIAAPPGPKRLEVEHARACEQIAHADELGAGQLTAKRAEGVERWLGMAVIGIARASRNQAIGVAGVVLQRIPEAALDTCAPEQQHGPRQQIRLCLLAVGPIWITVARTAGPAHLGDPQRLLA